MIKTSFLTLLTSVSLVPSAFTMGGAATFNEKDGLADFSRSLDIHVPFPVQTVPALETPGFCIFNGSNGSTLPETEAFKAAIRESDVVYVGESHDQFNDHLAQLEALKALHYARGNSVVVGFEMLNMTLQPVLDEYASGKITEAEFLKRTDWQKEWGFDFNLYKPLFDFIREKELRALALNLPKKVVSKIAKVGLTGLSAEELQYLPSNLQVTTNEQYISYLKESFEGHLSQMFEFKNYLAAMSAWNETMGARLADFINANPDFAGLAVAGSGHVIYNAGIPASVKSRAPAARGVSFFMQGADACPSALQEADKGLADYVWYARHTASAEKTMLRDRKEISDTFGKPRWGQMQGATNEHTLRYVNEEQRSRWPHIGFPLRQLAEGLAAFRLQLCRSSLTYQRYARFSLLAPHHVRGQLSQICH